MRAMRARATSRRTSGGAEPLEPASGGMRLGRILAVNGKERVMVEYAEATGPTLARLAVPADARRIRRAIERRDVAVLAFENGDAFRPLVLALLPQPSGVATAPGADPVPTRVSVAPTAPVPPAAPRVTPAEVVKADVDGRRVLIEGQDEIVFRCGKASVTLRRNGKVVIRGTYVETFSEGTNRVKGGQVRIN